MDKNDFFPIEILNGLLGDDQDVIFFGKGFDHSLDVHVGFKLFFGIIHFHTNFDCPEFFIDGVAYIGDFSRKLQIRIERRMDKNPIVFGDVRQILFIGIQLGPKGVKIGDGEQLFFRTDMFTQNDIPVDNRPGDWRENGEIEAKWISDPTKIKSGFIYSIILDVKKVIAEVDSKITKFNK